VTLLLSIFANDVLPIFVVAFVGFLLARFLKADVKTLSRVTFNALVPCLTFSLLVTSKMTPDELGRMMLFTVCLILGIGLIARLLAFPLRLDRGLATAFMIVVMFSNGGNYGLSVNNFAFGQEALARATIYFVTSSIMMYTVGVFLANSGRTSVRQALAGVFKVPAVYGAMAAVAVMLLRVEVPPVVMRPIQLLSGASLPCMILVLGMQMERADKIEQPVLVGVASALSLIITPLLAWGLVQAFGLSGAARQAAMLQSSMPTAVVTTILALEYQVSPTFVTNTVFLTTLLSPFTVTVLIALLQR
jgi:malate permease and related proteins